MDPRPSGSCLDRDLDRLDRDWIVIWIVIQSDLSQVTITNALVIYRKADLEKLFELVRERSDQQSALSCPAG